MIMQEEKMLFEEKQFPHQIYICYYLLDTG